MIVAVNSRISDKRKCVDANCSVLISTAIAQLNYNSDDPLGVSFPAGAKVEVYSYAAGLRSDLWGIKYKGKRGYGPKALLRENKIFVSSKKVNMIVPTEISTEFSILNMEIDMEKDVAASNVFGGNSIFGGIIGASAAEQDIKPDKVRVVEGTTLYNMENNPDDENVAMDFVTPVTPDSLPLPVREQVPETTTTPTVVPSKNEGSKGESLRSESVNKNSEDVKNKHEPTGSSVGSETKHLVGAENINTDEEGDYADYEEDEDDDEAEVEDESENINATDSTEESVKKSIVESESSRDVESENATEEIIEQQQNMQTVKSIYPAESPVTKEESSNQIQNESSTQNVKSEHPEVNSLNAESEENENMKVDKMKQHTADMVLPQSLETVEQSEAHLESPLSAEQGLHINMDTNKVNGLDSIPEQPQSVVKEGEMSVAEKEEKDIEKTKIDQTSPDISSGSEVVQGDTRQIEENQKTEEKFSIEHVGIIDINSSSKIVQGDTKKQTEENQKTEETSSVEHVGIVPEEDSAHIKEPIGDESNTVTDNVTEKIVSNMELGGNEQQFATVESHIDPNVDTGKSDVVDLPQTVHSQSNKTEEIGGTNLHEETSVDQFVGVDSKDDTTIQQEDVVKHIETVVVNDEVEKLYDSFHDASKQNSMPLPSIPKKVPEIIPNEEPSISEEASTETFSEVYITSIMAWFSSSVKIIQSYFQSPADYNDIPNTAGEEPSNTVSSVPESSVERRDNWDQIKSDPLKDKSCLIQNLGGEDSCEKVTKLPPPGVWPQSDSTGGGYELFGTVIDIDKLSYEMIMWLLVTAGTILTFMLGHYYIEAHRRDGLLVARINKLERELLVLRKESSLLEDQLLKAQDEIQAVDSSSSEAEALIYALKMELEENKAIRMDLEDQVTSLEKELESVTESGLEMHRLLSESLSNQDGSQVLLKTVENLRVKLNAQNAEISLLNQNIVEKNEEIESLKNDLAYSQEMYKHIEERLKVLQREKEEEALELKDKHRALSAQLEEIIEAKALDEMRTSTEISKLKLDIEEVQRNFAEKEAELETMKDAVKQLQSVERKVDVHALYDVVSISAKLKATVKEKDEFKEKFLEEEGARKLLEDHVRVISREVASLKENFEAAEREKIDALTKLQVLSNYFKEKESQLQKELGLQESMWLQKQSDDHTIYEQMKSLREENEKYKLQNESLKKEICEQESSFKIQIANIEQRAHENWVACRQSERRLKEVQQEASQLRNRLTLSEKNAANHTLDDAKPKISESNGDPSSPPPSLIFPATTSPPFMMYPGLPGEFIPPPPLVSAPFSPDSSRPPPLGRISSPQLDLRFSPPPPLPYSPYDFPYGGHHSPSPPPPLPQHRTVHKPQPRENAREQKDSSSTNYNASEITDKPSRRNKR